MIELKRKKNGTQRHSSLASYPVVGSFFEIDRRFPVLARKLVPSCDNIREGFFSSLFRLWPGQKSHYRLRFPRKKLLVEDPPFLLLLLTKLKLKNSL